MTFMIHEGHSYKPCKYQGNIAKGVKQLFGPRSKVTLRRESRNCWDIEALQDVIRIKYNYEVSLFSRYKHVVLHCRKKYFLR